MRTFLTSRWYLADLKRAAKFYGRHAILFTINTGKAPNTSLSTLPYFVFLRLGLRDDDTVYKQVISNQIIFIGLRSSKDYYKRPGEVVGVRGKGHLGVSFLRWSICWRRWVRWLLRGTGTASGHPGVS